MSGNSDYQKKDETAAPVISVVIVHWNTEPELTDCLASLMAAGFPAMEIIIIDNNSDNIDEFAGRPLPSSVRLVRNAGNRGFAPAVNQGLNEARGRYVLLLNPDIQVRGNALQRMVDFLETNGRAAVTGKLCGPDGSFQRYNPSIPTTFAIFARFTLLEPFLRESRQVKNYLMLDMDPSREQFVEQAPGACLMVGRDVLDELGGMDERYPLFFNDVDLSLRLTRSGVRITFLPETEFLHQSQVSLKKMPKATMRAEMNVSAVRFVKEYYGGLKAIMLKAALFADMVVRFSVNTLRFFIGKKGRKELSAAFSGLLRFLYGRSLFD